MSIFRNLSLRKIILSLMVLLFMLSPYSFASKDFEPVFNPTLRTSKTTASIKIDGVLDEDIWSTLMRADNFVERQPGDNTKPEVETYAYITYDDDNLYIGFKCFDDPAKIRATMCERDQFDSDDAVVVFIDTYGNAAWAYEFIVNPYGVQKDLLWSSVTGDDKGYDLIWESAAQITSDGYEVEMAIPFSSMRFPSKDVQEWKIDFWRNHPRESFKTYSWSANNRDEQCFPCQWGTVEGIRDVSPSKGLEILPTFVASQSSAIDYSSPDLQMNKSDVYGELSLGGKYSISSDITMEAAYNPDFSQIEADVAQIDVNTTIALFYPERRPFFQEGRDIFQTLFNSFYTRTVNDPEYAVKMISRKEKTRIGFLTAKDEVSPYTIPLEEGTIIFDVGQSYINVLRGTQNIGGNNEVGVMVSDRRFENGGSGSIFAFDHSFRLSKTFTFIGQYIWSHTKEPDVLGKTAFLDGVMYDHDKYDLGFNGESFTGNAFISQIRANGRNFHLNINVDQVSPSYRTQVGFDPVNNDRNLMINGSYTFRFNEESFLERITPFFNTYNRWNFDGTKKMEYFNLNLNNAFRFAQAFLSFNYNSGKELYRNVQFDGLRTIGFYTNGRFSSKLFAEFSYNNSVGFSRGQLVKDKENSIYASINYKPIDRITIQPSVNYVRANDFNNGQELFKGYITRTRVRYQASKELATRLVLQYNDFNKSWDIDPLLTYRISPFSVFYLGSSYNYGEVQNSVTLETQDKVKQRQFFVKLQYLFQP